MSIDQTMVQLIMQKMKKTGWIELPAEGTSMFPLIKRGDICRFEICQPHLLKRADIALFYANSGQLVAHRFYNKQIIDDKEVYLFKGDSNIGYDASVSGEELIGKMTRIYKKTRAIKLEKAIYVIWGKIIMAFPVLSGLIQRYLRRKSIL